MQSWLEKYMGTILTIAGTSITIVIAILGYFLKRTMDQVDARFEKQYELIMTEITERKDGDRNLELKIESKLDLKQFNEFKNSTDKSFTALEASQGIIQEDIKEILKNTR